jgi:hypothetical protein
MTAIAAICRDVEIVIAADSRRLNFTTGEQTLVCKIRDLTSLFAAVSGINSYDATQFNVYEILPAEMPAVDIGANLDSIKDLILPPLTVALEHIRENNADFFQRLALQQPPLNISFARIQNGRPTMINFGVGVEVQGNGPLVITQKRKDWPVHGLFYAPVGYFVGTDEGVAHYRSLVESGGLYTGDLVEHARSFVQMEIDKQTPEIGGPIDILRLTVDGATWIQRKDGCLPYSHGDSTASPARSSTRKSQ